MGLSSLIEISSAFVSDALTIASAQYKTKQQMRVFIHTMRGHVDTDAFLNLELDRFHTAYFVSLPKLLALSYLCEGLPAMRHETVNLCPLEYIRTLWQHVLRNMTPEIVFSDRVSMHVRDSTSLFVHTSFSTFASDFLEASTECTSALQ